MSDVLKFTILGCGSSPGTPRINGDWGACDPANPRNRRTRAAALVERISGNGRTTVLIDCGPDMREQLIRREVRDLDAVLVTHPHADHIHGIDDLRSFALDQRRQIPIHADDATAERLVEGFRYCFERASGSVYDPIVRHELIEAGRAFEIAGAGGTISVLPFRQHHGRIHSLGFRIGSLVYCSDVSDFPDETIPLIEGADHLVIDALQYTPHPSHLSVSQALRWIERLQARNAILTHMHTPLDYATLAASLPANVRPAYDGLILDIH